MLSRVSPEAQVDTTPPYLREQEEDDAQVGGDALVADSASLPLRFK